MPIIRRLFGPFMPEREIVSNDIELTWSFFGIKDDYSVSNWLLCYKASKRNFSTHFIPHLGPVGRTRAILHSSKLIGPHPILDEFKTIFLDDRPVLSATTTTEILKKRLTEEDRAACIAASIEVGAMGA